MTKEKRSSIEYLEKEDIATIYDIVAKRMKEDGEPMPSISLVSEDEIDSLVKIPKQKYNNCDLYKSLEEKAAILFYTICKGRHIFPNGNKRMSVACLLVFLVINNYQLDVSSEELRNKALALDLSDTKIFRVKKLDWRSG